MVEFKTYVLLVAVLFLGLVNSTRVQKRASEFNEAFKGRDVNKTIAKVEAILAKNPLLPRLTRGEILALFDNITKTDALKKHQEPPKNVKEESNNKPEKEKSLMVVLPFNANNNQNSDLEELYTRQPVTRIVGIDFTTPTPTTSTTVKPNRPKKRKNGSRRKPTSPPNQEIRPVYVEESKKQTTDAQSVNDNSSWMPITEDLKSTVLQSNVGLQIPQYMKDTLDTLQNSNNQVFVTVPPQISTKIPQTTAKPAESSSALPNIAIAAQSLTPELKNLLVSLGLLNPDGSQVQTSSTTTTTTRPPPPLIQYISINPTVDPASYIVFKPLPVTRGSHRGNKEEELSDDMRHFLANFGLTSDTETYRSQKALDAKNTNVPSPTTSTTTSTNLPLRSSEILESSNGSNDGFSIPNFSTDSFTDDMKDVLENMGLMKKPRRKSKGVIFNPATRTAGLLSQSEEKEKVSKLLSTIKELSAAEKNKSLSTEEITAQLQNITASLAEESQEEENQDLELVEGEESEMSYEGYEPAEEELLKLQNGFVDDDLKDDLALDVSENDSSNNNNNDLSQENLSDSSNTLTAPHKSLKDSKNPPDPLSPEELNHFIETNKNEVRRQQPKNNRQQPNNSSEISNDVSSTTEISSLSESSSESSSDEPKSNSNTSDGASTSSDSEIAAAGDQDDSTPSTDDLIDSFGGENPPENRPNGLYFLVDWNTFLRVGTDNKTVDLNFSPKVGNPKNFLPVTVP